MPKNISKTLNVTRVSYQTVEVSDGVPGFVIHPDAVFSGQIDEAKAKKHLQAKLGKDAMLVITKVDAGQHRFEMPLEFFVLNAKIADGLPVDDDDGGSEACGNAGRDSSEGELTPVAAAAVAVEHTAIPVGFTLGPDESCSAALYE